MSHKKHCPYHAVAEYQEQLAKEGWRWRETLFADGTVHVRFTRSPGNHVFDYRTNENYGEDCRYGWGRFPRAHVWKMAFMFLVMEAIDNEIDHGRLLQYKQNNPNTHTS